MRGHAGIIGVGEGSFIEQKRVVKGPQGIVVAGGALLKSQVGGQVGARQRLQAGLGGERGRKPVEAPGQVVAQAQAIGVGRRGRGRCLLHHQRQGGFEG